MKKFLLIIFLSFFIISCNVKGRDNTPKSAEEYYEIATKQYSEQNYSQAKANFYELIAKYPDSDLKNKSEETIKEILEIDKKQLEEILKDISLKIGKVKTALGKEELLQKVEKQYKYDYLYKDYPDIKDYISEVREQIKHKLSKNIVKDISIQVKNCKTAMETKNLLDHIKIIYENSYLYEANSDVEQYIDKTMSGIRDKLTKETINNIATQIKHCNNTTEVENLLKDLEKKYENEDNEDILDIKQYIDKTRKEIQAKLEEERVLNELGIELLDLKTGWRCNDFWSYPMVSMKVKNIGLEPITNLKVNVSFELNNERIGDQWGYFVHSGQVPLQSNYMKPVDIWDFDYKVDKMKFTKVIAHLYISVSREEGIRSFTEEYKFIKTLKIRPVKLIDD